MPHQRTLFWLRTDERKLGDGRTFVMTVLPHSNFSSRTVRVSSCTTDGRHGAAKNKTILYLNDRKFIWISTCAGGASVATFTVYFGCACAPGTGCLDALLLFSMFLRHGERHFYPLLVHRQRATTPAACRAHTCPYAFVRWHTMFVSASAWCLQQTRVLPNRLFDQTFAGSGLNNA